MNEMNGTIQTTMKDRIVWRQTKNRIFQGLVYALSFAALIPLFLILYHVFSLGLRFINWDFLTHLPKPTGELGGGISNAIVGTLMLIAMAFALAVPLGVTTGIYLSQNRNTRLAGFTRLAVDMLQGIPSVVIGIVAYVWVVKTLNHFSAFSGSVALAIMMLPIVVRGTEEVLKVIPDYLYEASGALGVPFYRTILKVIVPAGLPGIISGVLLAVSRIVGETAPLLFTAFGNRFMEWNPLKAMNSLPLLIFNNAMSPYEDLQQIAWGASVVLIILVLGSNIIARLIVKKWKVQF
jgi:phosphate transport system permease protein